MCDSSNKIGNSDTGCENRRKASSNGVESNVCKRSCRKLYLDKETADVHFIFPSNDVAKRIPAHKYMLALGSPVFKSMFYGLLKEEGDVTIADADVEPFVEFLQFFYLDNIHLTMENASEVMYLVDKYGATDCFSICENFLKENFSSEMVFWSLELAINLNRIDFRQFLLQRIMDVPEKIFSSDSFKNCSQHILKVILNCEKFNCPEKLVLSACVSWSENSCVKKNLDPQDMRNVRQELGDCLYQIQFAAMQRGESAECVSRFSELFTREELIEIFTTVPGNENAHVKYFVGKTRVKPLEWKSNASLRFRIINLYESVLLRSERTCFGTNRNLLLGVVATENLNFRTGCGRKKLEGVLKVCELAIDEVLLEQQFSVTVGEKYISRNNYKLIRPVPILSQKLYAIQIEFKLNFTDGEFTAKKSLQIEKFSVQDHIVSVGYGIVSHLYFN